MILCSLIEDDWLGMFLLVVVSFIDFIGFELVIVWWILVFIDGVVVVCDGVGLGFEVVGMVLYMDLWLMVFGEVVFLIVGFSFVVVVLMYCWCGLLCVMCVELYCCIVDFGYLVVVLYVSEGGIYGWFGYGFVIILYELMVD